MNESPLKFTAAQIAVALGVSRQASAKALSKVVAEGTLTIQGIEVPAWSWPALPERIRAVICVRARQNGQTPMDFVSTVANPWQPSVPLGLIAETCLIDARNLRDALLPALQRLGAVTLTPADRLRLGLADYMRIFGHTVTQRHWRRMMDRTIRRDGGENEFQRLELYLPDTPARKPAAAAKSSGDFQEIVDVIEACADPMAPTKQERAAI